jgi:hypothetical protein
MNQNVDLIAIRAQLTAVQIVLASLLATLPKDVLDVRLIGALGAATDVQLLFADRPDELGGEVQKAVDSVLALAASFRDAPDAQSRQQPDQA